MERQLTSVECSPPSGDVVSGVDFILGHTFKSRLSLLVAESEYLDSDSVEWRHWDRSTQPFSETVIQKTQTKVFRQLLARIGHHYMDEGCLYGGVSNGAFSLGGQCRGYTVYMSNNSRTGFWVRLYSWSIESKVDETSSSKEATS